MHGYIYQMWNIQEEHENITIEEMKKMEQLKVADEIGSELK